MSDVYDYLQRPVHIQEPRKSNLDLRQHFGNVRKIEIADKSYYILPSNAPEEQDMGRSEKIILYSEDSLQTSIDSKSKPVPDALLKLPKHGRIKQVQNEAMALGIASAAFGLTTASATMVHFEGKPAIFVPFDDMTPLTKVAAGKSKIRSDGRVAHENSTLNPIGSGLTPNIFVEDFGNAFGLMYLSGDPDAVGWENQNKGYQGNKLYVFDQAITTRAAPPYFDLFNIDSRLCQTPSTVLGGRIRHTRGRNFSLLEDASTAHKFDSLSPEKCNRVLAYCDEVIAGLDGKSFETIEDFKQNRTLLQGAQEVKQIIQERIDQYKSMLPKADNVSSETVKNALIFEKILNKPRLYTDLGRPYRNLTTTKPHELQIKRIRENQDGLVSIEFKQKLTPEVKSQLINKLNETSLDISSDGHTITLEASLLNDLERLFYPETANELTDSEYFSQDTVKNICETYSAKPNTFEKFVNKFKTEMQRAQSDNEQISILNIFRKNLKNSDLAASNPGLHKHLTKNFEFTIQQKLQEILQNRLNKQLLSEKDTTLIQMQNQAFSTAVKLDLLQEFNSLCIQYARQPNNQQLTTSIQSIFADFSQIDETTMSMDDAAELREEFLSRMQNTLSEELTTSQHKDTQHHFRKEIQKITSREHVDEDVKNVSNTENTPPHPK